MSDDIKIHKGLIILAFGLLIALAAAVYVTIPNGGGNTQQVQYAVPATQVVQSDPAQPAPPLAQPQVKAGGCGCGGGGQASAPDPSKAVLVNASNSSAVQDIYIKALSDGTYDKSELTVKKGVPVRLHFTADPNAGCGRQMVIYSLNIRATSTNGEESIVEFIPQQEGTYDISCGMRMWGPAKLVVTS